MLAILIVAWLAAFTVTHIPLPEMPQGVEVSDKTLHRVGFGGLTFLLVMTMLAYRLRRSRRLLLAIIVLPIYAAFDELTQPYCNRTCDIHDWTADMTGMLAIIFVAEIMVTIVERWHAKKS